MIFCVHMNPLEVPTDPGVNPREVPLGTAVPVCRAPASGDDAEEDWPLIPPGVQPTATVPTARVCAGDVVIKRIC